MKNFRHTIIYSALVCAIFTNCSDEQRGRPNDIASPVYVEKLKLGSIDQLINTTGNINATYSTELKSEVAGDYQLQKNRRTNKPFKLGDKVNKGELIVRIDDVEYENKIAIKSKKLAVDIAEQEQVKHKALYEKGGVTLGEMRNSDVRATNARYDYDNALISLEKMNIIAPFNGVIVSLPHYTKGIRIDANRPIVGIMDYSQLYMEVNLPESTIQYIKPEQPIFATHYTLKRDTLKGVISELSPAISTETRTFKGKVIIQNPNLKLRPGMFVKVDILVDKADKSIIISKDVIQLRNRQKFVYIVEKNTAIARNIVTGLENENYVEVRSGLKVDDDLVVKGYETLRDKSKVKVQ